MFAQADTVSRRKLDGDHYWGSTVITISLCFGQNYSFRQLLYLTRYLFSNITLLLEHRDYDTKRFLVGRSSHSMVQK